MDYFYRLPMELRESNDFSRVCLPFCLSTGALHVTITHDALDLTVQDPQPPGHQT